MEKALVSLSEIQPRSRAGDGKGKLQSHSCLPRLWGFFLNSVSKPTRRTGSVHDARRRRTAETVRTVVKEPAQFGESLGQASSRGSFYAEVDLGSDVFNCQNLSNVGRASRSTSTDVACCSPRHTFATSTVRLCFTVPSVTSPSGHGCHTGRKAPDGP